MTLNSSNEEDVLHEETSEFDEPAQESNLLLYMLMVGYLVAMVFVSITAYRRKQAAEREDSEAAVKAHFGGKFNVALLALTTFSSVFSGYTVMGVPQEAAAKGFFALRWFPAILSICAGMLLYYPRIRKLSELRGYQSPNDFITDRFRSKALAALGAFCACFPQLMYLTVQMVSFGELLRGVTFELIPKLAGMIIFVVIVLSMEKLGGMNSVVLSDAVQAALMIVGFILLLVCLTYHYGTLGSIGPADCDSLAYVSIYSQETLLAEGRNNTAPELCLDEVIDHGAMGCIAFGCVETARPDWIKNMGTSQLRAFFWFVFNFLVFPLNPHMVQRVYIASHDGAVKLVLLVMVFTPFLAMTPGLVGGVVKATFQASWPVDNREASAFAAIGNELRKKGIFEYVLVSMLTCSGMAAIMSTADSVILGVSNCLSIDIFKGLCSPHAAEERVVRFGEAVSVVMTLLALVWGYFITSSEFGKLLTLQNGILFQILPAYLLGLYTDVSATAVIAGIAAGVATALFALYVKDPVAHFEIPAPDFGAILNFVVIGVVQLATRNSKNDGTHGSERFGEPLDARKIRESMTGMREPNMILLVLFFLSTLMCVPWWSSNMEEKMVWGFPQWGIVVLAIIIVGHLLGFAAISTWIPVEGMADGFTGYVKRILTGKEDSEDGGDDDDEDDDDDDDSETTK